jgi:hypothetical protein
MTKDTRVIIQVGGLAGRAGYVHAVDDSSVWVVPAGRVVAHRYEADDLEVAPLEVA